MDEKKAYEAFRLRKFAQPHPALQNTDDNDGGDGDADGARDDFENEGQADTCSRQFNQQLEQQRVILHFDCDCFYAQVEEVRNPALRQVPLGITQKYLIVTCNYLARAAGVTKLMGIRDAMARCPGLVLVSGEDLGPYRQASKAIHAVLSRYGPAEKLGMDETFVDVTEEVLRRIRSGAYDAPAPPPRLAGHLHSASCAVAAETSYRPQDLRAVPAGAPGAGAGAATGPTAAAAAEATAVVAMGVGGGGEAAGSSGSEGGRPAEGWELLLTVGSLVAAEARAAVRSETGFRSSAGEAVTASAPLGCRALRVTSSTAQWS
ncbi:hypothetical protein PLESTM_000579100 [Pleodorina starrii]|nr:hypothetical protein PLESTM_000579100 [Pleodorina starrii]